jgi:hypothetical protein
MAEASTTSPNILPHSSKALLVVIIIEPFSYLFLIISKNSSTEEEGIFLNSGIWLLLVIKFPVSLFKTVL